MQVIFLGNKQAGIIGLLTTIASGHKVRAVVTQCENLSLLSHNLGYSVYDSICDVPQSLLDYSVDLLVSVHCREIIPQEILGKPYFGGINVHPCLSKFKGVDPIGRFLVSGETKASVGVHFMTDKVDEGYVICETFVDIPKGQNVEQVYNRLYPYYGLVLLEALRSIEV